MATKTKIKSASKTGRDTAAVKTVVLPKSSRKLTSSTASLAKSRQVEVTLKSAPSVPRDPDVEVLAPLPRERAAYDGDTAIKLYLREIGLVKLLTPQEEIELAAKIKKGDKKARELMIKANLRLVVKIAHDYEGLGLPLLDLINEGNIGLMKEIGRAHV